MLDLTFITSNITKLAHARHICNQYDVNIIQHKFIHYGKGYDEPRLSDREKLLELSVRDAINRWKRHVSKLENRFFFLEDTSVKINALSDEYSEIPGVDIKYFMQATTFEELDQKLKAKGNDRSVVVYSHLVLVLTKELQKKYDKKYIIFNSKSEGKITDKEHLFETQLLYPWLDNKSFNKWFVPTGFSYPISMLPIEEADLGDFRKGAFNDLLKFLLENNKIHEIRKRNFPLKIVFQPIFLISGPTCAGKTTIGKFLVDKLDYYHIEASDFMTLEFLETHGNKSNIEIGVFAKEILKVKPYIVVERIISFLDHLSDAIPIVITGFRTNDEIDYFLQYSPFKGNIEIVFVNAEYETRYQRWNRRNRQIRNNQKKTFDRINRLQNEMGLFSISARNTIKLLLNNSSFEDYYDLFIKTFLLNLTTKEENDSNNKISDIAPKTLDLEEAVFLSLLEDYRLDQQVYYTTTQISYKIGSTFTHLTRTKHKDNISRYFNQRYYPFFEIIEINKKLKYRLSPTGYSKAISIYKKLKHELTK